MNADSNKVFMSDEGHLVGNLLKINRKISIRVPLKPDLHWAYKHAHDNCKLPRGKRFDKFRGKDGNDQYDKIAHFFGVVAEAEKQKFIDVASALDRGQRLVITDWIPDPFWP